MRNKLGLCRVTDQGWSQIRRCGCGDNPTGHSGKSTPKKARWAAPGVAGRVYHSGLNSTDAFTQPGIPLHHPQPGRKAEALLPSGGSRRQSGLRLRQAGLGYLHRPCPARREGKEDAARPCGDKRASTLSFLCWKTKTQRGWDLPDSRMSRMGMGRFDPPGAGPYSASLQDSASSSSSSGCVIPVAQRAMTLIQRCFSSSVSARKVWTCPDCTSWKRCREFSCGRSLTLYPSSGMEVWARTSCQEQKHGGRQGMGIAGRPLEVELSLVLPGGLRRCTARGDHPVGSQTSPGCLLCHSCPASAGNCRANSGLKPLQLPSAEKQPNHIPEHQCRRKKGH